MGRGRYRHLSFEEREQIAIWRLERVSQAEMARRLGRSLSTIDRELARNRLPSDGYQLSVAARSSLARPGKRAGSAVVEAQPHRLVEHHPAGVECDCRRGSCLGAAAKPCS
jgi:IS30 family transposase